jgi:hypothetical protein
MANNTNMDTVPPNRSGPSVKHIHNDHSYSYTATTDHTYAKNGTIDKPCNLHDQHNKGNTAQCIQKLTDSQLAPKIIQ